MKKRGQRPLASAEKATQQQKPRLRQMKRKIKNKKIQGKKKASGVLPVPSSHTATETKTKTNETQ